MLSPTPHHQPSPVLAARMGERAWARRSVRESGDCTQATRPWMARLWSKIPIYRAIRPLLVLSLLIKRAEAEFVNLERTEVSIPLSGLPEAFHGFRILHLSDLHLDLDPAVVDRVLPLIEDLEYDLAVFTGDFIDEFDCERTPVYAGMDRLIQALRAPGFAVLGNHDKSDLVAPLETMGLRFLLNEHTVIRRKADALALVGVDDSICFGSHDLPRALAGIPENIPKLLLSHSPDLANEAARAGISLMLCGHTHGGQLCLPNGWGRTGGRNIRGDQRAGLWQRGQMLGYTSRGAGGCHIRARLNCRPEITRLQLQHRPPTDAQPSRHRT